MTVVNKSLINVIILNEFIYINVFILNEFIYIYIIVNRFIHGYMFK